MTHLLAGHTPLDAYGIQTGGRGSMEAEGCIGGRDGLRELRETLETAALAYGVEDEVEVGAGTDEEWEDEAWDI